MTRKVILLSAVIILFCSLSYSQNRIITGKIVDKAFQPIWGVNIFLSDTTLLGKTDSVGIFSLSLPASTNFLRFAAVGFEWKYIHLQSDCNHVEVILMLHSTYDFMSLEEVDRLRKKEFKKLPKLHAKSFEQGMFRTKKPCYDDIFISVARGEY